VIGASTIAVLMLRIARHPVGIRYSMQQDLNKILWATADPRLISGKLRLPEAQAALKATS